MRILLEISTCLQRHIRGHCQPKSNLENTLVEDVDECPPTRTYKHMYAHTHACTHARMQAMSTYFVKIRENSFIQQDLRKL